MNATAGVWIAIALAVVLARLVVRFAYDQKVFRRCSDCGCGSFDETAAARICRKCGRPWWA